MRGTSRSLEPLRIAHLIESAKRHPLQLLLTWQRGFKHGSEQVAGAATCGALQQPGYGAWVASSSMPSSGHGVSAGMGANLHPRQQTGCWPSGSDIGWTLFWSHASKTFRPV